MEPALTTSHPTGVVVYPPAPGVVVCVPAQTGPKIYDHFPRRLALGLGIGQAVAGCLCAAFNGVSLAYAAAYGFFFIGHGSWGGILFAVTGGVGIDAARKKTKCSIVAFLVLCIVSAVVAAVVTSLSIVEAKDIGDYQTMFYCAIDYKQTLDACQILSVAIAMASCVAVSAYTALVLCIWGAVICIKKGVGCGSKQSQQPQLQQSTEAISDQFPRYIGASACMQSTTTFSFKSSQSEENINIKTRTEDGERGIS